MVKKNNKSELLTINSLPIQNENAKFEPKQIVSKNELDEKIKAIKPNTEPINKQIPKTFWKGYF